MARLVIDDPDAYIKSLQDRGLTECFPNPKGLVKVGPFWERTPFTTGKIAYRVFGAIHSKVLVEIIVLDNKIPAVGYKRYRFLPSGLLRLKRSSSQIHSHIKAHSEATNQSFKYWSTRKIGGPTYGPAKFRRRMATSNNRKWAEIHKFSDLLNAIRFMVNGEWFYTLSVGKRLSEFSIYQDFLRALREADLGRMDERGGRQPGAGAPGFSIRDNHLLDRIYKKSLIAAQHAKSGSDPALIPEISKRYGINPESLMIFFEANRAGRIKPSEWAREQRRIVAKNLRQ